MKSAKKEKKPTGKKAHKAKKAKKITLLEAAIIGSTMPTMGGL